MRVRFGSLMYLGGRVQAGEGTKLVPENNLTKYRTLYTVALTAYQQSWRFPVLNT